MASPATLTRIDIRNILLATDFSAESQTAFYCAASLARHHDAMLYLAHILPPEGFSNNGEPWPSLADAMRQTAEREMTKLENAPELKEIRNEVILRRGDTWDMVAPLLAEKSIDLIVMGTHGYGGVAKLILGSTAERFIRNSSCPVLTVGPHVEFTVLSQLRHILCATDFSSGSQHAFECASSLADSYRSDLLLLHVIEGAPVSDSELNEWKNADHLRMMKMVPLDADLARHPEIVVATGNPATEIVRIAEERRVDLIVMGSHPGGMVSTHVPWTTLHHILERAHCPVLTVRGE